MSLNFRINRIFKKNLKFSYFSILVFSDTLRTHRRRRIDHRNGQGRPGFARSRPLSRKRNIMRLVNCWYIFRSEAVTRHTGKLGVRKHPRIL